MIKLFEDITCRLTEYEQTKVLPLVRNILRGAIGRENAISNVAIIGQLNGWNIQIKPARIRKVVSFIRSTGTIPGLIANGKGYFRTSNIKDLEDYIESLNGRIRAITARRDEHINYLNDLKSRI